MALLNSKSKNDKVKKLAQSGNVAAQKYLSGSLKGSSTVGTSKSVTPAKTVPMTKAITQPTTTKKTTSQLVTNIPGVYRSGNNYGLGVQQPLSFTVSGKPSWSVLPGINQMFQMPSTTTSGSTMSYAKTEAEKRKLADDIKMSNYGQIAVDVASVPLTFASPIPGDEIANTARLSTKYGAQVASKTQMWTNLLTKAKGAGAATYKYVKNLFAKGGDDALQTAERALGGTADDLARAGTGAVDDVARQGANADDLIALNRMRQVEPALQVANTARNTLSTLGRIVGGTFATGGLLGMGLGATQGAIDSASEKAGLGTATSTAGQIRNAVPVTATAGATTGGTTATGGATTTQRASTTTPTAKQQDPGVSTYKSETGSVPVYAGPSGVSAERTVSPSSLAGVSTAGGSAPVGEYDTTARQEAGARAIELQQAQANEGVGTAPIGDEANLAALTKARDRAKELLNAGLDDTTRPEFQAQVQQMLAMGISNLRKIQPVPPIPVVDTMEQASFLDSIDPVRKLDVQAEMDAYRQQLGMPDLEAKKADFNIQLNAINETYTKLIDEIKANPNMPKSLAARRLTEVFNNQKFALGQVLAKMDSIEDQIESNNKLLDHRLGILGMQQDENEKQYTRIMDKFGMMVDSGAVGGMSDKEMSQWSQATGIPEAAIRQMKKQSLDVKTQWDTRFETDADGNVVMISYDKNNPVAQPTIMSLGRLGKGYAPDKPSAPKEEEKLSLNTVLLRGLPATYAGMTESKAIETLQYFSQDTPPAEFVKAYQKPVKTIAPGMMSPSYQSFGEQNIQDKWEQYRKDFLPKGKDDGLAEAAAAFGVLPIVEG